MRNEIAEFEAAIKREHHNFATWAGGTLMGVGDRDIVGGAVNPDGGDWVVYDARGQTGFIGVAHDNWSDIAPVKVRSAKELGINLRLKKIPRVVSTIDLMKRYLWINDVFLEWLHVDGGSPYFVWKTPEEITEAYEAEAAAFEDDPHLALYWLMHFGLCLDPRYGDVADSVRRHGHDGRLDEIRMALAFFDNTGPGHEIDLTPSYNPKGKDYSGLMLRRRANLLFMTYGLSYRGNGAAEPVWLSVSLSRGYDPYAILRMRWLRNTLEKYDLWDALGDRLNDPASDDIPFIAYARLFQPGRADTAPLADALVAELIDTRPTWSARYAEFGKVILHDIRAHAGDQAALKAAAEIIFDGDLGHAHFADILTAIGEDGFGDDATRAKLAEYEALFDGKRLRLQSFEQNAGVITEAGKLLTGLDKSELSFFVAAVTGDDARKVLLRHVTIAPVADQEDHIVTLFPRAALRDYDLKRYFEAPAQAWASDPDQPLCRAMLRVLTLPETAYSAARLRKDAREAACRALRPVAHMPEVFDPVVALIEDQSAGQLHDVIFSQVFDVEHAAEHQPVTQLTPQQACRLMLASLDHILTTPDRFRDALRLVGTCTGHHPDQIDTPQTPVFQKLAEVMALPQSAFEDKMSHEDAVSGACLATLPRLHLAAVFDALLDMVAAGNRAVWNSGVFAYYAREHGVFRKLAQPQIDRLLDTCVAQLCDNPEDTKEALRCIEDCVTPQAVPWITRALSDASVLAPLRDVRMDFRTAAEVVERRLEDLLEDINEGDS